MHARTFGWNPEEGWSAPLDPASDGPTTAVFVFGASDATRISEPLRELGTAFANSSIIGCSTAGEIIDGALHSDSLVAAVCRFDSTRIVAASEEVRDAADSGDAGRSLGAKLLAAEPELSTVFVLSDGISVNGSELVAGLVDGVGPNVALSGGLAGDGANFTKTWVYVDGRPQRNRVAALGLAGPALRVGYGSGGGWAPLGPERRVTRASGNVLYELDGQPALALYKRYLGERAAELPASALLVPLSVRSVRDDHEVLRTVLGVDETDQSMTFAGDIELGAQARLMRATFDHLVDGAQRAATACAAQPGIDTLAVAVSCVGRRLILSRRTEDELAAVMTGLPAGAALIGYYSYGEISPRPASGVSDLLNQTMTVTTFQEAS